MNREDYIEDLKKQYAEAITEAYLECEHEHGEVDYVELRSRIDKISKAASIEGLKFSEYHELVCGILPHEIVESLYPEEFTRKAS
jgi:hypothetical protein